MLAEFAPAKINLSLQVTGRRADGYHLLNSLVVFAGVGDEVSARQDDGLSLTISGTFAGGLEANDGNLVLRAARALREAAGVRAGAALHLVKNLPVASGIGGGSSDAAAALRVLGRLWGVDLAPDRLLGLALTLGADVPVCLAARPRVMTGVGEGLHAAPKLPACGIVLVNPGEKLATPAVFKARAAAFSEGAEWPDGWADAAAMASALAGAANDLQAAAIALCPPVGEVLSRLAALEGALLARMSGSGATCFALFDSAVVAQATAREVARPGWWCWGGPLYEARAAT